MEIIKEKTIAFTGNRSLTSPSGLRGTQLERAICNKLYELLEREYLENGITSYLSGYAVGYDTLAAMAVLELRRKYPTTSLIAVIPFEGQEAKFSYEQQRMYREILKQADHSITISPNGYSNEAYHQRNDFLIANSIKMYGYHNGKPRSGTGSTMRKAGERGVEVINLYDMM
ncbi:MAG: SLOG family protein [Rikenellaceae bacterium]